MTAYSNMSPMSPPSQDITKNSYPYPGPNFKNPTVSYMTMLDKEKIKFCFQVLHQTPIPPLFPPPIRMNYVGIQENAKVQMSCFSQKRLHIEADIDTTKAGKVTTSIYLRAEKRWLMNHLMSRRKDQIFVTIYKQRTHPVFAGIPHSSVSVNKKITKININYFKLFIGLQDTYDKMSRPKRPKTY